METYTAYSIVELNPIAKKLVTLLNHIPVVALYGPMGVGKTTFIKEVCSVLGVSDTVNSPSFAIVNEYRDANDAPVFHFDLYRLKHANELIEIGGEDYFYSGHVCFVEWPEKAENLLPEKRVNIHMEEKADGSRILLIKPFS